MNRRAIAVSSVLGLTLSLAVAARSEQGFDLDDAELEAPRETVLRNQWISRLPYVTDVQAVWKVDRDRSNKVTSVDSDIAVMTDTEDHKALLEKQLPGSLEGFPVVVVVDRSKQWELDDERMMAKAQSVIDDPANKWILRIPHVTRMLLPSMVRTTFQGPSTPAIGIAVDSAKSIKEVRSKVPKTIGGFPTRFGWVDGMGECFTKTGKGCSGDEGDDHDDD